MVHCDPTLTAKFQEADSSALLRTVRMGHAASILTGRLRCFDKGGVGTYALLLGNVYPNPAKRADTVTGAESFPLFSRQMKGDVQ